MPQLAIRERMLSAGLVGMIGTRAPDTKPALSALARKLSCFASMLPDSRSGTRRISGSPETGDRIPLISAACLLIGLSNGKGRGGPLQLAQEWDWRRFPVGVRICLFQSYSPCRRRPCRVHR
jgi:hypothetical protein